MLIANRVLRRCAQNGLCYDIFASFLGTWGGQTFRSFDICSMCT